MRIVSADLAVFDPAGTAGWYRDSLGATDAGEAAVLIGGTVLRFHPRRAPAGTGCNHIAFDVAEERLGEALSTARAAGRHLPGDDGAEIQAWPFLSARAVYLAEPRGDVLELIARPARGGVGAGPLVEGVAEVGLLVDDAVAAARELTAAGVPVLGEPTADFAFVGDLEARLVLIGPGRPWFPTDRPASETVLAVEVEVRGAPETDVELGPILVRVGP